MPIHCNSSYTSFLKFFLMFVLVTGQVSSDVCTHLKCNLDLSQNTGALVRKKNVFNLLSSSTGPNILPSFILC